VKPASALRRTERPDPSMASNRVLQEQRQYFLAYVVLIQNY